jgi:hypothetical protein
VKPRVQKPVPTTITKRIKRKEESSWGSGSSGRELAQGPEFKPQHCKKRQERQLCIHLNN